MKKQFFLLLIGAFAINFVFAQATDTIKGPDGKIIFIIDHGQKKIPNRGKQNPSATPDVKNVAKIEIEVVQKPANSFLSNEGIIFAILLAIAVTWLMALSLRRRDCNYNCCRNWPNNINFNGTMRHEGNVNHSGVVEHTKTVAPVPTAESGRH